MEQIVELLKEINIAQVFVIVASGWFFYNRLDLRIEKIEQNLSHKIDKLDEKVTDIDRRVCRIEGAIHNKECCMIKDEKQMKKAE